MDMYKYTDYDGESSVLTEKEVRELARYYYHHGDVVEDLDYMTLPIEESLKLIRLAEEKIEVLGGSYFKNQLEEFALHVELVMNESADEHEITQEQVDKPITISLEGKTISFPLKWDTMELFMHLLRHEKENGHYE